MKKIKYGNRKNEGAHRQLEDLREGDEICEGVLDTLSEDYLSYITHLVKHSKTPLKRALPEEEDDPSSDSQPLQPPSIQQPPPFTQAVPPLHESKQRHHSQTGPKRHEQPVLHPPPASNQPQPVPRKLSFQKETIARGRNHASKNRPSKMVGYPADTTLKNQQKTMSFTRNIQSLQTGQQREELMGSHTFKGKKGSKGSRCYTNSQQSQLSHEKISIHDHMLQRDSQRDSGDYPFIFQIDNYISHLETNPQSQSFFTKNTKKNKTKESRAASRSRHGYREEYSEEDVRNILKENLKLQKRVRGYEEKVEELQDEVSTHLIQCKSRDKHYRHKIADLVKALTQAASKINHQKQQITSMKQLLRTFGQKVKQIEHQQDDSEPQDSDIGESIIRYMQPPHEPRTKQKRGLESTMPRHEDDRKYWYD